MDATVRQHSATYRGIRQENRWTSTAKRSVKVALILKRSDLLKVFILQGVLCLAVEYSIQLLHWHLGVISYAY